MFMVCSKKGVILGLEEFVEVKNPHKYIIMNEDGLRSKKKQITLKN